MSNPTASQMTREHLGPDATEADLIEFRQWVAELMAVRAITEQEATELLWGDGDYIANAAEFDLTAPDA